jgi:excisionase family DNA binding protein
MLSRELIGRRKKMPKKKTGQESRPAISTTLSTSEVASIFEVHPSTVRRWSEEGKIQAERVGTRGDRRFRREEVAVYYLDRAIEKFLKGKSA